MKPRQPLPVARREKVAIPSGSNDNSLGDAVEGLPGLTPNLRRSTRAEVSTNAGRCPEVQGMSDRPIRSRRATSASAASARSRSAYAPPDADPAALKRRIQAGPAHALALRRLPAAARARARSRAAHRLDAAGAGRPPRRAPRPRASCASRTRPPTRRTRSRTASSRSRSPARRSSASTRIACASTGNLANAVAAHAAAAGLPAYVLHPGRPRGAEDPRHRRLRRARRRRQGQLRRRQPPLHRGLGRARRLGVRERQHAPVLRRGLQDARLRDRRAARLGAARTASSAPIASGSLFTKIARGFQEFIDAGLRRGRRAAHERRPGRGLLAGRPGVRRRARRLPPGQAGHDRQVAGHRQPRRRPVRDRARAPHRRRHRLRRPTTRSAPASACWPRRPASSPRPPAA